MPRYCPAKPALGCGPPLAPASGVAVCVRRTSLLWLLVLAFGCTSPASPTEVSPGGGGGASGITASIVDLTNAERGKVGIPAVRVSSRLMQAAQLHADQMARFQRMEHELSGAQYPRPVDRLAAVSYRWSAYGENIA